jgi:hypothetical protein
MLINYLNNRIKNLNREQVDAYSRYAHALSVSSAIGAFGMLFADEDLIKLILKVLFLGFFTIILFKFGTLILEKKNDD